MAESQKSAMYTYEEYKRVFYPQTEEVTIKNPREYGSLLARKLFQKNNPLLQRNYTKDNLHT